MSKIYVVLVNKFPINLPVNQLQQEHARNTLNFQEMAVEVVCSKSGSIVYEYASVGR